MVRPHMFSSNNLLPRAIFSTVIGSTTREVHFFFHYMPSPSLKSDLGNMPSVGAEQNFFQPYVLPVEIWSFSSHINNTVFLIQFIVLLKVKPFRILLFVFYFMSISWVNPPTHNSLQDILLLLCLISTVLSSAGFPNKAASTIQSTPNSLK